MGRDLLHARAVAGANWNSIVQVCSPLTIIPSGSSYIDSTEYYKLHPNGYYSNQGHIRCEYCRRLNYPQGECEGCGAPL